MFIESLAIWTIPCIHSTYLDKASNASLLDVCLPIALLGFSHGMTNEQYKLGMRRLWWYFERHKNVKKDELGFTSVAPCGSDSPC